ncbi:hypothetical protein BJ878DRAFT_546888 [Calycina marina]|uniref:2EXR domain-containing protein n=1 Tax=Calycina marina TaxID=1763456 RepID=A0A9P8CC48_9HELO|nr:hypothetical protein BJ878DRAFT_546888 [Calycina marina]
MRESRTSLVNGPGLAKLLPAAYHTEFTFFSELPTELRDEIWKQACQFPRIVDIQMHESSIQPISYDYAPQYVLYTRELRISDVISVTHAPAVLQVCRESRQESCNHYRPWFYGRPEMGPKQDTTKEIPLYANSAVDTIFLRFENLSPATISYAQTAVNGLSPREEINGFGRQIWFPHFQPNYLLEFNSRLVTYLMQPKDNVNTQLTSPTSNASGVSDYHHVSTDNLPIVRQPRYVQTKPGTKFEVRQDLIHCICRPVGDQPIDGLKIGRSVLTSETDLHIRTGLKGLYPGNQYWGYDGNDDLPDGIDIQVRAAIAWVDARSLSLDKLEAQLAVDAVLDAELTIPFQELGISAEQQDDLGSEFTFHEEAGGAA